jgi:hypothetical protein
MNPMRFARGMLAGAVVAGVLISSACELEEGVPVFATIEFIVRNPSPGMLSPDFPEHCFAWPDPMFAVLKRLSQGQASVVTDVNVSPTGGGIFDANSSTCTYPMHTQGVPGLYRAVATDGNGWLTRCQDPFQFFFAVPPARHVIRFTFGEEGCELDIVKDK